MRALTVAAIVGLCCGLSVDAAAFHPADTFVRTANRGGGAKILYNGSARFRGYDCTMCHQGAPGNMQVVVTSDPPELLEGTYTALGEYTLTVEMIREIQPPEGESNFNLFVAEFVDDRAEAVGRFEEIELSSLQRASGDVNIEGAVFGANDRSRWTFTYFAPPLETGRISFHLGAVTGDSGLNQPDSSAPSDPFGDDVFIFEQRMCEAGASCDTSFTTPQQAESPVGHGCSVSASSRDFRGWWLLALVGALPLRRSRTSRAC